MEIVGGFEDFAGMKPGLLVERMPPLVILLWWIFDCGFGEELENDMLGW